MKFIEICAISNEDIDILNNTNIDRIQIIASPQTGGLTPSYDLIEYAANYSQKEISIFLRCNSKSFVYDKEENKILLEQIKKIKEIDRKSNRNKFVAVNFGYLNIEGDFLKSENKKLVKAILPYNGILNHCVDNSNNYHKTIKLASKVGFVEVLSNGNIGKISDKNDSIKNLSTARELKQLMILCGGGLNLKLVNLLYESNLKRFHLGSAVRFNKSWNKPINPKFVNKLK